MIGRHHAITGASVWFGVAGVAMHETAHPVDLIAATAVCAAAAVLPDIDEPGSSVARSLGAVSETVSKVTNKVCGGHRTASHSFLGAAVVGGLTFWATTNLIATAAVFAFLIFLAWYTLMPILRHGLIALGVGAGAGVWAAQGHLNVSLLPVAVTFGYLVHLCGDMLTSSGVPLFWPVAKHFRAPILGHTGSKRETVLAVVMLCGLVGLIYTSGVWRYIEPAKHLTGF